MDRFSAVLRFYLDTSRSEVVDATDGSSSLFISGEDFILGASYDGTNSGLSSGSKAFVLDSTNTLYFDPSTDTSGQDTNAGYSVVAGGLDVAATDITIIG